MKNFKYLNNYNKNNYVSMCILKNMHNKPS